MASNRGDVVRYLVLLLAVALLACNTDHYTGPVSTPAVSGEAEIEEPADEAPESLPETLLEHPSPEPIQEPDISPAEAKLLEVSARHEALIEPLRAVANRIDDVLGIGTMFNEIGVSEARCYAMGTILGLDGLVAHLDYLGDPDLETMSGENAHALRVQALRHANFAGITAGHVGVDRDEVAVKWNLDCPGRLGIPATASVEHTGTSSFYNIRNDGRTLMILGDIEQGFADKVIAALKANPSVEAVSLGSGGGYVLEAMRAGQYLRNKGYDTVLWNSCYSACPLVFMAGNLREIWSPYPDLGFHQVYDSNGLALSVSDPIYTSIELYLHRMGVEPRVIIEAMKSAPPNRMTLISGADPDLCKFNVATWVHRFCHSDSHVFRNGR